jgi:hypothetical protein
VGLAFRQHKGFVKVDQLHSVRTIHPIDGIAEIVTLYAQMNKPNLNKQKNENILLKKWQIIYKICRVLLNFSKTLGRMLFLALFCTKMQIIFFSFYQNILIFKS